PDGRRTGPTPDPRDRPPTPKRRAGLPTPHPTDPAPPRTPGLPSARPARLPTGRAARHRTDPAPGRPPMSTPPTTALAWATADPYTAALRAGRGPLFLRRADGWLLPLEVERWCARADPVDRDALDR